MDASYDGASINKGNIAIGFTMSSSSVILNSILTGFKGMFPMIDLSITDGDSSTLKENVIKNTIDAAFVDIHYLKNDDKKHLDIYPLAECDLVVVASVNNSLSSRESISYSDLDGKDVVLYQREGLPNNELSFDLKTAASKPKIVDTSSQLLTILIWSKQIMV
jgi:DNA-binding transcriptional LysR family regulator